jgi:hypothetical protein
MRSCNSDEVFDRSLLGDGTGSGKTAKPPALAPIFVELCIRDGAPSFPEFLFLRYKAIGHDTAPRRAVFERAACLESVRP